MKKLYKLASLGIMGLSLTSCTVNFNYSVFVMSVPSVTPLAPIEKSTSSMSFYQNITASGKGISYLPSIGQPNILVVPIDFIDYRFSSYNGDSNEKVKERLNDAFFGERENDEYIESVSSYYQKSSNNNLTIKGSVTDVITAPESYLYYANLSNSTAQVAAIENIIKLVLTAYNDNTDYSIYDTDNDGYIDSIWLVYSAPMNVSSNSIFWAFTTWTDAVNAYDGKKISPFSWASYSFLDEGGYTDHPDCHTFIHETGHLLGLDDFYNYDDSNNHPTGALDMMDYNIGDHMAFSKYNLGWIIPEVVDDSTTDYELSTIPSLKTALLVPYSGYSRTSMFWDYLLFEYYTPTGLNYLDSTYQYGGISAPRMFTTSGLRVYRIKQKMYYYNSISNTIYGNPIVDFSSLNENEYFVVINSNSPSLSYNNTNRNEKLVELVSATKYDYNVYADNSALFVPDRNYVIPLEGNNTVSFSYSTKDNGISLKINL